MTHVVVAFVFFTIGLLAASLLSAAKVADLVEQNDELRDQLDAGRPKRDPVTGRFVARA